MAVARAIHRRLNQAGYTVTYPRPAILHALGERPGWFSAEELVDAVAREEPPVGRASVFRLLALLEDLGLVERVHRAGDTPRYVVGTETAHHHHLVCPGCGQVGTVVGCGLEGWIPTAAEPLGFAAEGHVVQVFGRCRRCRLQPVGG